MRKPKPFKVEGMDVATADSRVIAPWPIRVVDTKITPAEARRLARWLINAAEWAEGRKKK